LKWWCLLNLFLITKIWNKWTRHYLFHWLWTVLFKCGCNLARMLTRKTIFYQDSRKVLTSAVILLVHAGGSWIAVMNIPRSAWTQSMMSLSSIVAIPYWIVPVPAPRDWTQGSRFKISRSLSGARRWCISVLIEEAWGCAHLTKLFWNILLGTDKHCALINKDMH